MRILISGGEGTLGTALRIWFTAQGHDVLTLVRYPAQLPTQLQWEPYSTSPIPTRSALNHLEGFDAAIHLSGEDISRGRWSPQRKLVLANSRIQTLQGLRLVLSALEKPPATLLTASAVGYYGNHSHTPLNEASLPADSFLSNLCQQWESAALAIAPLGIRVVPMRFGAVLTPSGGMLKRLLPIFRAGLGGRLGDGRQYLSWISITDACRIAEFLLAAPASATPTLCGAVNATSPQPVTNAVFTRALAAAVRRSANLPVPAFALRLAYGELADELLLSSTRALPARLLAAGFHYLHPDIDTALAALLTK